MGFRPDQPSLRAILAFAPATRCLSMGKSAMLYAVSSFHQRLRSNCFDVSRGSVPKSSGLLPLSGNCD